MPPKAATIHGEAFVFCRDRAPSVVPNLRIQRLEVAVRHRGVLPQRVEEKRSPTPRQADDHLRRKRHHGTSLTAWDPRPPGRPDETSTFRVDDPATLSPNPAPSDTYPPCSQCRAPPPKRSSSRRTQLQNRRAQLLPHCTPALPHQRPEGSRGEPV